MNMLGLRDLMAFCYLVTFPLALAGCGSDASRPPPDNLINIGFDGGTLGCAQPSFPSDQPDLSALNPPVFLLTNTRSQQSSVGQAQVSPGEAMEAEISVNGATRQLKVELANAWARDDVIDTAEEQTSGNEAVQVVLFSDDTIRGRYYLKLTLCDFDCDERQVVFDLHPCSDDPETREPCGINAPYDRTLIEDGDIVQVDATCIDLGSTPGVGSGTILIQ